MPKRLHLRRYRQIIRVFARNGFGIMLEQLGVFNYLKLRRTGRDRSKQDEQAAAGRRTVGERLRLSCEELGPTFVKIGQILSTRPDILTPEVSAELSKLQDAVNPFPFDEVKCVIEQEFGEPLEEVFASIERVPLASASLSQVHKAILHTGQEVAVKVQRPGIRDCIKVDLEILQDLASFLNLHTKYGEAYDFPAMIEELERTLNNELDFRKEGENADRFRKNFLPEYRAAVPDIRWIYTTERVLTMSLESGLRISEIDALKKAGHDLNELGMRLAGCMVRQVLDDGIFHADPHPGNILVQDDGTIVFLDLGMVGRLSEARRQTLSEMFIGIATEDAHLVVQAFADMDAMKQRVNLRKFESGVARLLDRYMSLPINQIHIGDLLSEIFSLAYEYKIRIPGEFTLLAKVLITLQGVIERLDPDLNLLLIMKPAAAKMIRRSYSLERLGRDLRRSGKDYHRLAHDLPGFVLNFFQKMEDDEYHFSLDFKDVDKVQKHFDDIANRISFSLILLGVSIMIAGIIIGTSMNAASAPELARLNTWMLRAGLAIAGVILAGLVISMFRSRRF
jgi:ubiquinone biosynthesis protein